MSVTPIKLVEPTTTAIAALEEAVRDWWKAQQESWTKDVASDSPVTDDSDLWDEMPTVDSKAVARTGPLFKEHFGVKLDVKLIRHGGYSTIDEMIADLVPKMVAKITAKVSKSQAVA